MSIERQASPDRHAVRAFSKTHAPEKRAETASAIRESRRRTRTPEQTRQDVAKKIEHHKLSAEKALKEIDAMDKILQERKNTSALNVLRYVKNRILPYKENALLATLVSDARLRVQQAEEELGWDMQLQEELNDILAKEQETANVKDILATFSAEQHELMKSYEREEKARDIRTIMAQHDALFIHSIHPNFVPRGNSVLEEGVGWETKLQIALALEPTLSASTIKQGDSTVNEWANMGVILGAGRVVDAKPGDAGSIAEGIKRRTSFSSKENIEQRVEDAVTKRSPDGYNEFVVEEPQIAGIYIDKTPIASTDVGGGRPLTIESPVKREVPDADIQRVAEALRIPVYVLLHGEAHESAFNAENGALIAGKKISRDELLQHASTFDANMRTQALQDILEDSPFRLSSPDVEYLSCRTDGQSHYIDLKALEDPATVGIDPTKEPEYYEDDSQIPSFSVATIDNPFFTREYYRKNNSLRMKQIMKRTKETFDTTTNLDKKYSRPSIRIGRFSYQLPMDTQTTTAEYLNGMRASIQKIQKERAFAVEHPEKVGVPPVPWKNDPYVHEPKFYDDVQKKLAFHLHGFAEQAEQIHDQDTATTARALADGIVTETEYTDLIKKRTSEKGTFKITLDDIPQ